MLCDARPGGDAGDDITGWSPPIGTMRSSCPPNRGGGVPCLGVRLNAGDGLAAVVRQLAERLQVEAAGNQADRLLVAAYVLTGLRLGGEKGPHHLFLVRGFVHQHSSAGVRGDIEDLIVKVSLSLSAVPGGIRVRKRRPGLASASRVVRALNTGLRASFPRS